MSDLHNLSSPTEESQEEILKKEVKQQEIDRAQAAQEFKIFLRNFKQKYLGKLFLSLGIAFTVGIFLLWIIGKLLSPDTVVAPESVKELPNESTSSTDNTVKFIKFDGNQYSFYVPSDYSFLNRTRNDDLNEIIFSDKDGVQVFLLQEFEADSDDEQTLDSIYSYIETTVPPSENGEIKIGDNTFKRRIYKDCKPKDAETLKLEAETGETLPTSVSCAVGDAYYSTYINGVVIIFQTFNSPDNDLEQEILPTFSKNITSKNALSDDYISGKLPSVKNKLQALFAFGTPLTTETDSTGVTTLIWPTSEDYNLVLGFNQAKALILAEGDLINKATFDFMDELNGKIASMIYAELISDRGFRDVLEKNLSAQVYIDDRSINDNFWEVTITDPDTEMLLKTYQVEKSTYEMK